MKEGHKDDQRNDLMQMAIARMNGGFDITVASDAIQDTISALSAQAKFLKQEAEKALVGEGNSKDLDIARIAGAMSKSASMVDDTTRLMAFVSGHADSRPDTGGGIFQSLKDWQIKQIYKWVDENEAEKAERRL